MADKIDVDIRGFVSSYSEKKQTLAALNRRQTYVVPLRVCVCACVRVPVHECVRVRVYVRHSVAV
jgi:hypothetical protein